MQRVICREKEPITPFLERARDLYEKAGISTILVAGSSGAFFHIADTVIQMDNYHPVDITEITGKLCQEYPLSDVETPAFRLPESHRIMTRSKAAPSRHSRPGQPERLKTKVHGKDGFSWKNRSRPPLCGAADRLRADSISGIASEVCL